MHSTLVHYLEYIDFEGAEKMVNYSFVSGRNSVNKEPLLVEPANTLITVFLMFCSGDK